MTYFPRRRQASEQLTFDPIEIICGSYKKTAPPAIQTGDAVDRVLLSFGSAAFLHRGTGYG